MKILRPGETCFRKTNYGNHYIIDAQRGFLQPTGAQSMERASTWAWDCQPPSEGAILRTLKIRSGEQPTHRQQPLLPSSVSCCYADPGILLCIQNKMRPLKRFRLSMSRNTFHALRGLSACYDLSVAQGNGSGCESHPPLRNHMFSFPCHTH